MDWDTPLMLASRHGRAEVGELLIKRFPRCIPWTNKQGIDAVSRCNLPSIRNLADHTVTAFNVMPQPFFDGSHSLAVV